MSVFRVLYFPDDRLRKIASPVPSISNEIQSIINDMIETMYFKEGIGLAATQINIHQRIVVIDTSESRTKELVLINPEIINKSGEDGIEEGCLSIPDQRAFVPRAKWVTVCALNRKGEYFKITTDGLLSICIQHEIDHLNGKLFIDYLSPLKRHRIKQKMIKLIRQVERGSNVG